MPAPLPVSVGYDGTVDEKQWADLVASVGSSEYGVLGAGDWKVTAHPSTAQAVNIAPGAGWGRGVRDTTSETITVNCDPITSGTRWDLIAMRRDWTPPGGETRGATVTGTPAKQIPPRQMQPGVKDDQPLALVQWTAGQTQPTAMVDLRCWAGNGGIVAADSLALGYLERIGAAVMIGPTLWRRVISGNGLPEWAATGTKAITYGGYGGFGEPPNSGNLNAFPIRTIQIPDPGFPYQIVSSALVEAGGGGPGTRWDVRIEVPGTIAIANARGDVQAPWFDLDGITVGAPFTGPQTVTLMARKLFGGGSLGISQYNQFFTAMVVPA